MKPVGVAVGSGRQPVLPGSRVASSGGGLYRIQYTLNTPPAITVQPQGKNVTVGDAVTFSVSASGTPPLSYQWQRNGAAISGATSSSYTIASAQLADNGVGFRCRVTNAYGNVTSNGATLGVTAEPRSDGRDHDSRGGNDLRRRPDDQLLGDRHRSRGRDAARRAPSSGKSSSTTTRTRTPSSRRRAARRPVLS